MPENENGSNVKKPLSILVFGIGNIIVGCYFMVLLVRGWGKVITDIYKATGNIIGIGIFDLLLLAFSLGLAIWILVLGYGLLTMKRWARRGSVLYGWIQVVLIVIILAGTFIGLSRMAMPEGFWKSFLTVGNALMLAQWIYMILLLIFMKIAKVKQAFAAIGG
jgi:hypothetical protein